MFSRGRKRADTGSVTEEDIQTLIEVGEEEGIPGDWGARHDAQDT